ncbi:MAG: hypothetical protein H6772_05245, partial [Pseudomonadales bacterium]|nr:hypothetical protein [Pseudomonadales bacterium]
MKYVDTYETKDKVKFEAVIDIFESKKIRYKKLHEYRLKEENDFGEIYGGAIIRVAQDDFLNANHLLISKGFKEQIDYESAEFKLIRKFKEVSNKIPILNKLSNQTQLILVAFILICISIFSFGIFVVNKLETPLIGATWCVGKIKTEEREFYPNTDELIIFIGAGCKENLFFHLDGTVVLPGFKTPKTKGNWAFIDDTKQEV